MDVLFLTVPLAALAGWALGMPLTDVADRLLASAVPDATDLTASDELPVPAALDMPWRLALRAALSLGAALIAGRAVTATSHTTPGALLLALVVATLALVAVLDGAAHLVFVETLTPLSVAVVLVGALDGPRAWLPMLSGALIAGGVFLALFVLGRIIYGVEALGFGDVQLAALFGALLGWPGIMSALALGLTLLLIVTLALLAVRRISRQSFVPIGLFLALGVLISALVAPPPWLR